MASVTQKIPNYVLGMSTQPDEKKVPGQVVDLVNGVPDVVTQLTKRPGSSLVKEITTQSQVGSTFAVDTGTNSKWFGIYSQDDEQYIGQCASDGDVKVWRCSDGVSVPVDYANIPGTLKATYLDNTSLNDAKSSDIQVMTVNETTHFVNRRKVTAMKTDASSKSPPQLNEAFIELDTISYGKQYALDIYDPKNNSTITYNRATAIKTGSINSYSGTSNGDCLGMGREYVLVNTGTAIGSTSPPNASSGGKSNLRYEMDTRCTPQPTANDDADDYHDTYQPFVKLQFGGEGWSTNDTHQHTSAKGVTTTATITNHVAITTRANIAMVRPSPTSSNNEEHVSAAGILGDLKAELDSITGTGITATIVGNGIHLYRNTPFGVSSPERNLMNVVTSEANNIADLPRTGRHGYTVRIVNSGEDMDDYYLKFQVEGVTASIDQTGTYARSGTTVTITAAAHGLSNGDQIIADFTSGAATDGFYTIANVTTNTFTITDAASGTISAGETVSFTPARFGEGVWEEVCQPNIDIEIDKDTMPLQLKRVLPSTQHTIATSSVNTSTEVITISRHGMVTGDLVLYDNGGGTTLAGLSDDTLYYAIKVSDDTIKLATSTANATAGTAINLTGTGNNAQTITHGPSVLNGGSYTHYPYGAFRFDYPDWGKRDVGDDITNPPPSFVGYPILKMGFFRNRIALLSNENVILSRVNEFHNFWVKTAMAISNADPIDLQSSSTYPTKLYDAVETNTGLVVFSANEQFLLSSGAEALLTPETAKVTYLSSYAFNPDTQPVSLGTTIGFINSTAKNARFYEMANISNRDEPQVVEQSKIIGDLFPSNITSALESNENQLLIFGVDSTLHTASNEIWGYKYFEGQGKRAQSAWFRWTFPNNVIYHTIMDDVYYAVLNTGSTYTLEKFDIKLKADTDLIGTEPDVNRVFLDTKKDIPSSSFTYNDQTDVTTFTLGAGYYSSRTLTAYCTQPGNSAGKTYDIPTAKITGSAPNETVTLPGNWKYEKQTFDHTANTSSNVDNITVNHVNISNETITLANHNLTTGDVVVYKAPTTAGGSTVGGLSDGTSYWVIVVDDTTIKLASNAANATAGTAVNLTATGQGTSTLQVETGIVIGYEYEFEVEFPKIYLTRSEGEKIRAETRGSLVLHRMNFDFGDVGVIDVTLKRKGRDDYTYTVESLEWDNVKSSTANIAPNYLHTIPVYDRNINTTVFLKSNHPSPATIHSMNWEGDYSPKYYQRV